jgi:hypothetical protein
MVTIDLTQSGTLQTTPRRQGFRLHQADGFVAHKFTIDDLKSINLALIQGNPEEDADLKLYRDNGNGVYEPSSDQYLQGSYNSSNSDDTVNYLGESGTYFAVVQGYAFGSDGEITGRLDLSATPISPYPADDIDEAPNLLPDEFELGTVFDDSVFMSQLGRADTVDTYSFSVLPGDGLDIELTDLTNDVDLRVIRDVNQNEIVDGEDEIVAYSVESEDDDEEIELEGVSGDFFLQTYMYGDGDPNILSYTDTNYTLEFDLDHPTDEWTFMVYLDGDNNLEGNAITDFLEMSSVGSSAEVNIVAQLDRISGYDSRFGSWTDTRRGWIEQGDEPYSNWGDPIGEVNMGDEDTLSDFIDWAISDYPADNYALVLWDHGGGWPGVCFDDSSGGDGLETPEVGNVLSSFDENFDFLGIDACLMGMVELAYETQDDASVFVASEENIPGFGWDYTNLLRDLTEDPDMDAEELGVIAVDHYGAQFGLASDQTLSAIDLTGMDDLSEDLDQLTGTIMSEGTPCDLSNLEDARSNSPTNPFGCTRYNPFGIPEYRDLGQLLSRVASGSSISDNISDDAEDALDSYDDLIIHNYSGDDTATGLSIHFQQLGLDLDGGYNSLAFAHETQWDEFLGWWSDPYTCGGNNDMSIV